ncbi:MAG: hypothetical protein KatS3mg111_0780 [Pirellulaceae bacterium]|nr:MAG: hypothetical protein KatS3mg111_0780 [Pirellulaceae bacterium]
MKLRQIQITPSGMLVLICWMAIGWGMATETKAQSPGLGWGHLQDSCEQFKRDFHRNRLWPAPFRAMDTAAVMSYFEVQRDNGWRLHNTLGTGMFDPSTNQLTDAGYMHLRWIVTQAPQERRVVFILRGRNESITAARVEAAQLAISELIPVGPLPPIYLTDQESPGSSGVYQTSVSRQITQSIPAPRLPPPTSGSSGSSSP